MGSTISGYQLRSRPSIDEICIDEILPADETAVIPTSSSSAPSKPTEAEPLTLAPSSPPTMTTAVSHPYTSFTSTQKRLIVTMVTLASFFSPLSGQIYYPIMPTLVQSYRLTPALINLTITTYMLLQGIAPAFMGTFADACGRRPAYLLSFTIYTASNIGLALQTSYPALMILRCLQSAGSSGTVAFGYGVIADIATPAERGTYVGPMAAGTMLAPALGPVIGGLLASHLGWRSVFWFLVIVSGGYLVVYWAFVPETARGIVGDGRMISREWWRLSGLQWLRQNQRQREMTNPESAGALARKASESEHGAVQNDSNEICTASATVSAPKLRFPNPVKTLFILLERDALLINICIGLLMFTNVALLTSTPTLFKEIWDFNDLQIGLCFLPLGIGASLGAVLNGHLLNRNYRRHDAEALNVTNAASPNSNSNPSPSQSEPEPKPSASTPGNFPIEKARLQLFFPLMALTIATITPYGEVLQKQTHLSVPLILQFVNGFATVACMNTLNTLLVDLFPEQPATAAAACNLVRCWLGALGAAVMDDMLRGMRWDGCFGFLGGLLVVSMGMGWIVYRRGMEWREQRR